MTPSPAPAIAVGDRVRVVKCTKGVPTTHDGLTGTVKAVYTDGAVKENGIAVALDGVDDGTCLLPDEWELLPAPAPRPDPEAGGDYAVYRAAKALCDAFYDKQQADGAFTTARSALAALFAEGQP